MWLTVTASLRCLFELLIISTCNIQNTPRTGPASLPPQPPPPVPMRGTGGGGRSDSDGDTGNRFSLYDNADEEDARGWPSYPSPVSLVPTVDGLGCLTQISCVAPVTCVISLSTEITLNILTKSVHKQYYSNCNHQSKNRFGRHLHFVPWICYLFRFRIFALVRSFCLFRLSFHLESSEIPCLLILGLPLDENAEHD